MHAGWGGILLVLAGAMNGSFALPMKGMPRWRWENIWLVWSVIALVLLPFVCTLLLVPRFFSGLLEVPLGAWMLVMLCGAAWGVAQVFFGLSVDAIGMALTFSLVLGISAGLGAVVPFFLRHAALSGTRVGAYLFGGLSVLALGMVLCGWAGVLRESANGRTAVRGASARGLLLAVLSGLCASAMNIGFSVSEGIGRMAVRHGAAPSASVMTIWLPLLLGGSLPNVFYTAYRLRRNGTAELFGAQDTRKYWALTTIMALLWFASTMLYGVASTRLGELGTVLGWPVFMSIVVITASFLGWLAGEWDRSGWRPLCTQIAGIAMLIVAVLLFSKVAV